MLGLLKGIRRTGAVVNIAAAGVGNLQPLFTVSTFASMVGTKTLRLRRLKIRNNGAGNTWVHIGTGAGAAFVHIIPALYSISNTTDDYMEFDLPRLEVVATINGYVDAVGVGDFDIQVEVEERG